MAVNVKAFLEKNGDAKGEIRRFQLATNGQDDQYAALRAKVADVFGLSAFQLWWQDSDGDNITFSSTPELLEAVNNATDGVLRIFVRATQEGNTKASAPTADQPTGSAATGGPGPSASDDDKVRHPGIICDGCESDIYGPRFKCVICPDYDLCQRCEDKGTHPEHDKFKITHPNTAGGHGYMPHHFRRFMNHFMGRPGANGPCTGNANAGASASASTSSSSSSSRCGSGRQGSGWGRGRCGGRWRRGQGCSTGNGNAPNLDDEYLKNIGENIQAFLDPFGVDVTYEVRHGDQKQSGQFSTNGQSSGNGNGASSGSGSFSTPFGPGAWQWNMFGNTGGCGRFTQQGGTPGGSKDADKQPAEAAAEAAAKRAGKQGGEATKQATETTGNASATGNADVEMEIPVVTEPTSPPAATQEPQQHQQPKAGSPCGSNDEDWTMLNSGDTTDGPAVASAPAQGSGQGECLYPNLKVAQAVEMMKNMGFTDDGAWLTRLLTTTDGDIAAALDKLKLGAEQAGRLM